ncbi:molecular chaperone TorD family protein [Escherichia coli]|nr:molecular chaperone TorD family protein [Escherichia coli]
MPEAWQRLFVGPWALPSPPWGSVWLDRESVLFGDSTLALRQWMREKGIAPKADAAKRTGRSFWFTVLLMAAWLCGEWSPGQNAKNAQLLAWHLFPWSTRFLERFYRKSRTPFLPCTG